MFNFYRPSAPLLEILRCLFYLLFDYFILMSNPWQLTVNERMVVINFIWFVRGIHIASILFWISKSVLSHERLYIVQKTVSKQFQPDIEKSASLSLLGSGWKVVIIFTLLIMFAIILITAFFLQIDSCNVLFHRLIDQSQF